MSFILDSIRHIFGVDRAVRTIDALENKINLRVAAAEKARREIDLKRKRFEDLRESLKTDFKRYDTELEKLEEALSAARDQITTAKEITIPGLIASHDVLLARWEKETRIAVMQATLARAGTDSE